MGLVNHMAYNERQYESHRVVRLGDDSGDLLGTLGRHRLQAGCGGYRSQSSADCDLVIAQEPASSLGVVLGRLVDAWDEGADVVARGAPHLVMTHAPKSEPLAPSACTIAPTCLELAASAYGLGACWMGLVDMTANTWPPLRQLLALPPGHVVWASMAIGHPAIAYARIPPRKELRVAWR